MAATSLPDNCAPARFSMRILLWCGLWAAFLWPALSILSSNFNELRKFGFDVTAQITIYCIAGAIIATVMTASLARLFPTHAKLLITWTTVAAVLFFFFGPIHGTISEFLTGLGFTTGAGAVFVFLVLISFFAIWLLREKRPLHVAMAIFTCAAALSATVEICIELAKTSRQDAVKTATAEPTPASRGALFKSPHVPLYGAQTFSNENVFYIIVDGYTGDRHLRSLFNYDPTPFITNMASLGFAYIADSRSNYTGSAMSIGSLFHLDYFYDAAPDAASTSPRDFFPVVMDRSPPATLLDVLRKKDYGLYLSESWYTGCKDEQFECIRKKNTFSLNQVSQLVLGRTPLKRLFPAWFFLQVDATQPIDTAFLTRLRTARQPAFVFAHHMQPHSPYYFDGDCNPIYADDKPGRWLYREAVRCTNKRLLEMVTRILAIDQNAIIVIHADHGSGFIGQESYPGAVETELPPSALDERTETVSFIRAPKTCSDWLLPNLGPINTMRFVLGCLSRQKPDYLPERVFITRRNTDTHPELEEYFGFSPQTRTKELLSQVPAGGR